MRRDSNNDQGPVGDVGMWERRQQGGEEETRPEGDQRKGRTGEGRQRYLPHEAPPNCCHEQLLMGWKRVLCERYGHTREEGKSQE